MFAASRESPPTWTMARSPALKMVGTATAPSRHAELQSPILCNERLIVDQVLNHWQGDSQVKREVLCHNLVGELGNARPLVRAAASQVV